ncbi:cytosine permease [Gemmobacter sp. 24YEA27]|uniref:cytosine permease n=1 Tax=Gemmobacter sp. 24YEA27 TaxID=3040672 RepID=UPI0024B331DA|nr:cytosine permease [Gemmobacter sp. 24YEA27]
MSPARTYPAPDIIFHDEPEVLREAAAEDFSLHIVPPSWRSSRFSLSMAWFGLMSAMFWVVVGSMVALTVGTINTLIGIALSTIVYGILCGIAARFAARSGTSVALFSRAVFGQVGATFAALLFGVTITYYAIAEGSIVAIALQDYFGGRSASGISSSAFTARPSSCAVSGPGLTGSMASCCRFMCSGWSPV